MEKGRKNNNKQEKKKRGSAFQVQLTECLFVILLLNLCYTVTGKLIYNDFLPLGVMDSVIFCSIMSGVAVMLLGANRYFSFKTRQFAELAAKVVLSVVFLNFLIIAILYFTGTQMLSPYFFAVNGALQVACLIAVKRLSETWKRSILRDRIYLVIGQAGRETDLLRQLKKRCPGRIAFASAEDEKLLGYIDQADYIYLCGGLSKKTKDFVLSHCVLTAKRVSLVPDTYEIALQKAEITQVGDVPVFEMEGFGLTEAQRAVKRLSDILLSVLGLVLSSPIMLFAVLAIKKEDGGPVFYRQIRAGLSGQEFSVLKFRSMIMHAEQYTGAVFAAENDPRITKIGRFMRASRIDEIPQFLNVLAGSMSLVGPRPVFVEQFSQEIPEYKNRLAVKPGITGLAQVMGNYTTTAENKVKFDLMYIRNYSALMDLKILCRTVKVVFTREQAEGFGAADKTADEKKDFAADTVFAQNASSLKMNWKRRGALGQRAGKAAVIMACCMLIVMGSLFLRYSALASAMVEAMAAPNAPVEMIPEGPNTQNPEEKPDGALGAIRAGPETKNAGMPDGEITKNEEPGKQEVTPETIDIAVGQAGAEPLMGSTGNANAAVKAGTNSAAGAETIATGVALSEGEIKAAIAKMGFSQKVEIVYKFISKVSASDLMVLEKMSQDGFTEQEKEVAKAMMYQYFDETEAAYIKNVYWEVVK